MIKDHGSILRNRNFILLVCAYAISAFGDHLSDLGILSEMNVQQGHDQTRLSALMLFCFFLPYVLLGPIAGVVADRLPRRWIMITADLVRAGIAASIPLYIGLLDDPQSKLMILPILGLGLFACFFNPARLALVPEVVGDRHLTQANSMLNAVAPIAAILSFVVGGILVDAGYTTLNFVGDGATYLASAVLLMCMIIPRTERSRAPSAHFYQDIGRTVSYMRCHRCVWQLMIFTATFWAAAGIFRSVLPPVVFSWYDGNFKILGILQASTGIGMLLGSVVLTVIGDASRPHFNIVVALLGTGLMVILFSLSSSPWVGGLCSTGVGLFGVWIVISATTLLQRVVPNYLRGRVFGIVDLVNMGGMVLATGILGDPFDLLGFENLDNYVGWLLGGLGAVLLLLGAGTWRHHLRRSGLPAAVYFLTCLNEVVCKSWYRLKCEGRSTIPPTGPCIVTANHISSPDPCLLIAANPNRLFGFMIAREYYELPVWHRLIKFLECVPVRRDGRDIAATKEALRQLRSGKALGIFIQGGIPEPGAPLELRDGVAVLALRSGVPVVPVHISGAKYFDGVLPSYLARHHIRISFGKPVDLSEFTSVRDREQVATATRKIWASIEDLAPANERI